APVTAAPPPRVETLPNGAPSVRPVPPAPGGKAAAAAGILVLMAGALAAFRHHVADFFGSLFR
ncbi:hypothetical protein EOD03_38440, partial [Mesorhizobium sp. M7A.T.Ca.TU.009.01.1.2]